MNIPNTLTVFRIALIPIFLIVYYMPNESARMYAALVFCLAGVTDYLDGYIARKYNQATPLGAFLDPLADKLMVCSAIVVIAVSYNSIITTTAAAVIICRELLVSALREWMAQIGCHTKIAVSYIGKLKTTAQICAIVLLTVSTPDYWHSYFGLFALFIAVVLTIYSMAQYLKTAILHFNNDINTKASPSYQ